MEIGVYILFSQVFHVITCLLSDHGAIQLSPLQFPMLHITTHVLPQSS
jgi:hypothetical protein